MGVALAGALLAAAAVEAAAEASAAFSKTPPGKHINEAEAVASNLPSPLPPPPLSESASRRLSDKCASDRLGALAQLFAAAIPASKAVCSDDMGRGGGGGTIAVGKAAVLSRGVCGADVDAGGPRLAASSALLSRYLYALQWRCVVEQPCVTYVRVCEGCQKV